MKSTLRNLINARIPELLELKMGCEVRHFFNGKVWIFLWLKEDIYAHDCYISYDWGKDIDTPDVSDIRKCILWTPPSWSDYLRCLGENYAIDGAGQIKKHFTGDEWLHYDISLSGNGKTFPKVNLTKWPLEQSDEILQKLVDLIPLL